MEEKNALTSHHHSPPANIHLRKSQGSSAQNLRLHNSWIWSELGVTTFGGRDVACKKTEEGEGSHTTKNWLIDWSPDFRYQKSPQDRSSPTYSSQNNPTSFPAQDPASSQGHSEEEASFRPFLGFRVSKTTKKRLGERERERHILYMYLLNLEKATDLLGR